MHASQVVSTSQAGLQALVLVQRTFAQVLALFYIMHSLRGCHSVMLYKCNYIVKEFSVFSSCSIILLTIAILNIGIFMSIKLYYVVNSDPVYVFSKFIIEIVYVVKVYCCKH